MFIERYRIVTAASEYVGDALVNSTTDIIACSLGFYLASRFRVGISIAVFCFVEVAMMFLVRDNLMLNVLMIVLPIDFVRSWQIAG